MSDDFALHPEAGRLLAGRRALVTGATTGIGRGTAFELAAHGAAVAVNYRGKEDEANAMGRGDRGRRRLRRRRADGHHEGGRGDARGVFLASREAARIMRADDVPGATVMVSSVHEQIPWMKFSHYCASNGRPFRDERHARPAHRRRGSRPNHDVRGRT